MSALALLLGQVEPPANVKIAARTVVAMGELVNPVSIPTSRPRHA